MIRGLGLDLCEISRMEKLAGDERFLNRYFNEGEIIYIRTKGKSAAQTMAGIYAAKEAFSKALGTGITFDLKEISIFHDEAGMPAYSLSGKAEKLGKDYALKGLTFPENETVENWIRTVQEKTAVPVKKA